MITRRRMLASLVVAGGASQCWRRRVYSALTSGWCAFWRRSRTNAGELVGDLNKTDFEISDNGVPQQISVFEHHTEQPLSVALLVDTSASTGIDLRYEVDSVTRFLRALFSEGNPPDAAALYSFDATPRCFRASPGGCTVWSAS